MSTERDVDTGVSLSTIALELGGADRGVVIAGDPAVRVRGVQQDSRKVTSGNLFVARVGTSSHQDGLQRFVDDAILRGAVAVMCAREHPLELKGTPSISVPQQALRSAIGVAASAAYGHPSCVVEVVGVTGTNGKTTTTYLLGDALDRLAGRAECAVIGTVGARLGELERATTHTTPEGDEIARLLSWVRDHGGGHAAMEVSSHALEQGRLSGTRVRAAAFTNLTQDHLDYHHTMEAYFEAKKRLFEELHPGSAVVCVDDEYGRRLADEVRVPLLRVSCEASAKADVRVTSSTLDAAGVRATITTPSGDVTIQSALLGRHNLSNLTLSLGVLIALGFDAVKSADALGRARAVPGRLELASHPDRDDVVVLIDYAHTPDALVRALSALRPITSRRLVCVFGCGGDRDPTKRGPMGRAVAAGADVAVVTSDNPRTEEPRAIVDAIVAAMTDLPKLAEEDLSRAARGVHVQLDRASAIARAVKNAQAGDVVLIAGKGHEDYQIIGNQKRPFDDVQEARRALEARRSARKRD